MSKLTKQLSIKIILAGSDKDSLTRNVYPTMTAAGFNVLAVVDTLGELRNVASAADVAIVEANIALTPDAAIELLSDLGTQVAVILPAMWTSERERFAGLPHLIAGLVAPVSWPNVIARLRERIEETDTTDHTLPPTGQSTGEAEEQTVSTAPAALPPDPQRSKTILGNKPMCASAQRIGFYGTRGGVGTSTAALTAARALAGEGKRVALFDATRRGDAHLMAGIQPNDRPATHEDITFFLCPPDEERIQGFDAVIVDGGRTRGTFNAKWITVLKPLPKDKVLHLVGIEPREDEKEEQSGERASPRRSAPPRKHRLRKLISIEVTE